MLLGAATPWVRLVPAFAGHGFPVSTGNHIFAIHYSSPDHGSYDEDACFQSYMSSVSNATLKSYLENALYATGGWDGTGNWKTDIWVSTNNYNSYADDYWVELRYDLVDGGCGGNLSCQNWDYALWVNGQIKHWIQGWVTLATANVTGTTSFRRAVINHETGHDFGLQDPRAPPNTDCTGGGWWFGSSVMHQFNYYGCPSGDIQLPTQYDKETVVNGEMIQH